MAATVVSTPLPPRSSSGLSTPASELLARLPKLSSAGGLSDWRRPDASEAPPPPGISCRKPSSTSQDTSSSREMSTSQDRLRFCPDAAAADEAVAALVMEGSASASETAAPDTFLVKIETTAA
eukprot:5164864-Prymnesium_polylepis.1